MPGLFHTVISSAFIFLKCRFCYFALNSRINLTQWNDTVISIFNVQFGHDLVNQTPATI